MSAHGIYKFLEERKIKKEEKDKKTPNFTSLGRAAGSYLILDDDLEQFYSLYIDAIDRGHKLSLTEKPGIYAPVLVDLDFRFPIDDLYNRKFDLDFLKKLSNRYFEFFRKYIDFSDEQALCYIFTRKEPYADKGVTKDGIHLVFPYLHMRSELRYLARRYIIETLKEDIINLETINPIDDVVDLSVIQSNNWFLFGSTKPGNKPYELVYIIDEKGRISDKHEHKRDFSKLVRILSAKGPDED